MDFNPPSPCGEGPLGRGPVYKKREFQSTLPVWGGTRAPTESTPPAVFQSTLPVWGGTCSAANFLLSARFQSTLPVWGGTRDAVIYGLSRIFQSTLPVWGGTMPISSPTLSGLISIHPPRVGRDVMPCTSGYTYPKISIHPPRVGRDGTPPGRCSARPGFQSTLPVWGGTAKAHKNSL